MLSTLDLIIVLVYLAGSIVAGLLSRGGKSNTEEYFTAGGGLGSFFGTIIVGLSLAATLFSGISFIAYPSVLYSGGFILFAGGVCFAMPLTYAILRFWFLPRYLAMNCKYPYEMLETRFGVTTRTIAATLFVCMRLGWMAAMIYAPTIAIMAMGRLDDRWFWPIVLVTGLSSTFYTVFAGIRGVIVTDAIQMIVIAIGIGGTILAALHQLPVPLTTAWSELREAGRLNWFNLSLDPRVGMTVWTVCIGSTVGNLANYLADQMSLQRYLATGNVQAACRSFKVNFIVVIMILFLLAGVGLSLFVFYAHAHDPNLPTKADKVFPHFVATQLPQGLSGLLLAALLAATMSSLTSGINALAGVLTLDFRNKIGSPLTGEQQLRFAKITSLVVGVVSTLAAGLVSKLGSIFELSQTVLGVFAGPLLACVVVAVSKIPCRGGAMSIAMLLGSAVGIAAVFTPLAVLWIGPVAALATVIAALAISALSGKSPDPVPVSLEEAQV